MPYRVDALVQSMQVAPARSLCDSARADPNRHQLRSGDGPMLSRSDLCDLEVELGEFLSHEDTKSPRDEILPLYEICMGRSGSFMRP